MSTHHDLIPEPHTRACKRISEDHQRRTFYMKISQQDQLPMSIPEELSYKHQCQCQASSRSYCQGLLRKKKSTGSPQDLLKRTCTRSCKDLLERTSPGSPQYLRIRTCRSSCRDLLEDPTRISTRSSDKDLHKIMQEPLREDFTRIPTISSYQNLSKLMQGPLRGSHQDLHKIFRRGPAQDHARTS